MSFRTHDDDRDLIQSVASQLGEDVAFIRQRGFHAVVAEGEVDEPDLVDFAMLTGGLDWDQDVEPRCYVRSTRRRPRAA